MRLSITSDSHTRCRLFMSSRILGPGVEDARTFPAPPLALTAYSGAKPKTMAELYDTYLETVADADVRTPKFSRRPTLPTYSPFVPKSVPAPMAHGIKLRIRVCKLFKLRHSQSGSIRWYCVGTRFGLTLRRRSLSSQRLDK